MTRSTLPGSVCLALALLAGPPSVSAQAEADSTVSIDIDSQVTTNDTIAIIPFQVGITLSGYVCLGTAEVVVALAAEPIEEGANATASSTASASAEVLPPEITFALQGSEAATSASGSEAAILTVSPAAAGQASNTSFAITASVQDVSCSVGLADNGVNPATAGTTVTVTFEAPPFASGSSEDGPELPGLPLAVLVLALAGVAFVRRRE